MSTYVKDSLGPAHYERLVKFVEQRIPDGVKRPWADFGPFNGLFGLEGPTIREQALDKIATGADELDALFSDLPETERRVVLYTLGVIPSQPSLD